MTVSTLRPDSTVANTGTVTGAGGVAHTALADDSDSSFITFDSGEEALFGLGDLSLPAGALIRSVTVRARSAVASAGKAQLLAGGSVGGGSYLTNWQAPATVAASPVEPTSLTDAEIDAGTLSVGRGVSGGPALRVYELYFDVKFVTKPVVTVLEPDGLIDSINVPFAVWSAALDSDGGAQTYYEVKVYTDAQYGAGGFDPDSSTPTATSGITTGADTLWIEPDTVLPDGIYRAYVRVAQTVNGALHWSDWATLDFEIDVPLPAAPTFTATADSGNGRITLVMDDNAGDATTDYFELQRSLDGGTTWEPVRQLVAGPIENTGTITVYDYEAPNGVETDYRARALHDYTSIAIDPVLVPYSFGASAWVTDAATWTSTSWWFKHPLRPDLNVAVTVHSFASFARAGRDGVFQAIGAVFPIVVSDTPASATGELVLLSETASDQDALDALLATRGTLLVQGPPGEGDPGYVRVRNVVRTRAIDWSDAAPSFDALEFVEVASPPGDVVAWPV